MVFMNKLIFLFPALLLLISSCASIFDKPYRKVQIKTKEKEQLNYVVEGDTISPLPGEPAIFTVKRQSLPLAVTVFKNSFSKTVGIKANKTSLIYFGNYPLILFGVGIVGIIVDELNDKKYVYPRKILLDLSKLNPTYVPYFPMKPELVKKKNRLAVRPLALLGFIHPGIDISYQRLHGTKYATQLNVRYFISMKDNWVTGQNNNYTRNARGFRLNLEEKFFFRNEDDRRLYASINFEYFRKDHKAFMPFFNQANSPNQSKPVKLDRLTSIKKRFFALTSRVGFEKYLTQRLVLDVFLGIGIRYRKTELLGVQPGLVLVTDPLAKGYDYSSNRPSKYLAPNFDLGFRIGWTF